MDYKNISWDEVSIANSGEMRTDDDGTLVFNDGTASDWHLLLYKNREVIYRKVWLRLRVRPHSDCVTNFYIHHWGAIDVAIISKEGDVVSAPKALTVDVAKQADGSFVIETSYYAGHASIMFGTYLGEQRYKGFGKDQYVIYSAGYYLEDLIDGAYMSFSGGNVGKALHVCHAYLTPLGWTRAEAPVDLQGNPVPWITYPAFAMLKQIAHADLRVFEFGCGNSSLWWAGVAREVVSVDHNLAWVSRIKQHMRENMTLIHCPQHAAYNALPADIDEAFDKLIAAQAMSGRPAHDVEHGLNCADFIAYAAKLLEYERGHFDIIVVDGMARSLCAYLAAQWVKPGGLIVFDNSDRWQYAPGFQALEEGGFARIDFFGPGPLNVGPWCTSIFARSLKMLTSLPRRAERSGDLGW